MIRLAVQVSSKVNSENNIKLPSSYKHRKADMEILANTGSQAVLMGRDFGMEAFFRTISGED